jgi:two-component system, OmpR family, phosphate regulon sensor histidine kinase PhoR
MFRNIRWRIAVPSVLLILVTMIGLAAYLSSFLRRVYRDELEAQLANEALLVRDNLVEAMSGDTSPEALDQLARYWGDLVDARITIIAPDGSVIGESEQDRATMDNHATRPEVIQALVQGEGQSVRYSDTARYETLYYATLVKVGDQPLAILRIALPIKTIDARIAKLQRNLAGMTLLVTILAVLLTLLIANQTTRPIRELTLAAEKMADGDLSVRLPVSSDDDVGQLSRALNRMADQIRNEVDALQTERGKLEAILQQMTDGLVMVDETGAVQMINSSAEKMFGISGEQAIGSSLAGALRQHQVVELWQQTAHSGGMRSVSFEVPSKRIYLQGIAVLLERELSGSVLLLFQNLTRQRYLETVRQDFISNISHELRTPLAALKALTETLAEGALDDPPAARHFLEQMDTEVDSLSLMVSELLELSRIESGRVPLNLTPTRPCMILSPAVERLHLQVERANLEVLLDCPEDLPLVFADPQRLEQVVVNLLHNAIKFTPGGGRINVSAREALEAVIFSVKDTGIGIAEEDLPRIFERFFKADRARSKVGTGLGLAISRHLVEAHGGKIWVESIEGSGSTFYFSIPLAV